MLNAQEAQERLKTFLIPDGLEKRLAAVKALEPKLRQMALSYMDCDEGGRQAYQLSEQERQRADGQRQRKRRMVIRPKLTPEEHRRGLRGDLPGSARNCWRMRGRRSGRSGR